MKGSWKEASVLSSLPRNRLSRNTPRHLRLALFGGSTERECRKQPAAMPRRRRLEYPGAICHVKVFGMDISRDENAASVRELPV